MDTLLISDISDLTYAAHTLQKGGLVVAPTETVYGLAANALDADAVKNIFKAKGRPSDNPLIVHIASLDMLDALVTFVPENAKVLMEHFWPGPLTLIFNASDKIPNTVRANLPTVAIRFPSHPIMQELIKTSGLPLAAPSANLSGKPSPTNVTRVTEDLFGKVDVIIDGGDCSVGLESTVVDMTSTPPTILRPGGITAEMLEAAIGPVLIDPALSGEDPSLKPKAPGMKYTHYSPNAEVVIVKGPLSCVVDEINTRIKENASRNKKVGVLATDETIHLFSDAYVLSCGTSSDLSTIAANLFEKLRAFDDAKVDIVYSLAFPCEGIGKAIMNRLEKSAGHHIINKDI